MRCSLPRANACVARITYRHITYTTPTTTTHTVFSLFFPSLSHPFSSSPGGGGGGGRKRVQKQEMREGERKEKRINWSSGGDGTLSIRLGLDAGRATS
jgi:hypothetical protein